MADPFIPVVLTISHLSNTHLIRTTSAGPQTGALAARIDGYSFLPAFARAKTKRTVDSIGA
jgi:hypothetical protein